MWLAGGGIKAGTIHGATDEYGYYAVENKVTVHDLHAMRTAGRGSLKNRANSSGDFVSSFSLISHGSSACGAPFRRTL